MHYNQVSMPTLSPMQRSHFVWISCVFIATAACGSSHAGSSAPDLASSTYAAPDAAPTLPGDVPTPTVQGYDQLVQAHAPVGYWTLQHAASTEPDQTAWGTVARYQGSSDWTVDVMPNGDRATRFNGFDQYLTIPSQPRYSIPTTGQLTWEVWLKPATLNFAHSDGGLVDYLGKCETYGPTCEWEGRLYNQKSSANRPSRFSGYVFNPNAGLGSGANWQPAANTIQAGQWYHVVTTYQILRQRPDCEGPEIGTIDIWVNGIKWDSTRHGQTGCISQFHVAPQALSSPVNVGRMSANSHFEGAIGKFAIYDRTLDEAEIREHYTAMTGRLPTGHCDDTCSF